MITPAAFAYNATLTGNVTLWVNDVAMATVEISVTTEGVTTRRSGIGIGTVQIY